MDERKLDRNDMRRMSIPREYWDVTIDHVAESVRANIANYIKNFDEAADKGAGLLLCGSVGVGKTTAAVVVAMKVRARARTALFTRVSELRDLLRRREMFDGDVLVSERIREVDLLVLDDLQESDALERVFSLSEIGQLVRFRSSWCRPTVITTRASVVSLEGIPDAGRFLDVTIPIHVTGENRYSELEGEILRLVQG